MASFPVPSTRLPPIWSITSHPTKDLRDAVGYLRHLYNPEVRGSRRHINNALDVGVPDDLDWADDLYDLRSDSFERSFAISWLTSLVSRAGVWASEPSQEKDELIQDAASLLAICSGTAAAGVIVRDFVFILDHETGNTFKVHIRDVPLDNRDFGSVGAQTWGGACVLAEKIVDNPAHFGLVQRNGREFRILELGAGTGLVSLTAAKVLEEAGLSSTIVATDYYPSVLENLEFNIRSNSSSGGPIATVSSQFLDWSIFADEPTRSSPFDGPFDLVLGADIIYEAQHAIWIKSCLMELLRKPTENIDSSFHLIIPLRATHSSESSTIETVFSARQENTPHNDLDLRITSRETIICDAGSGLGSDQIEYAYYRIEWC